MLAYALARHADALGRLDELLVEAKALGDEGNAFGAELDDLVRRAYRGRMSVARFADLMDELLATYIRAAYLEGLAAGGIDEDEIDAADKRVISQMIAGQRPYVDGFAEAVMDAKSEAELRGQIDNRILMWTRSVRAAGGAGVNSAAANQIVIFSGQMGEEDCPECLELMGARHRRSWFADHGKVPGVPGNCLDGDQGFSCCGYNCQHFLAPVGAPLQ